MTILDMQGKPLAERKPQNPKVEAANNSESLLVAICDAVATLDAHQKAHPDSFNNLRLDPAMINGAAAGASYVLTQIIGVLSLVQCRMMGNRKPNQEI